MGQTAKVDFSALKTARQTLEAEEARLRSEMVKLKQKKTELLKQREEIASAPLADEELAGVLCELVDREAHKYLNDFTASFKRLRHSAEAFLAAGSSATLDPEVALPLIPKGNRDFRNGRCLPVLRGGVSAETFSPRFEVSEYAKDSALFYLLQDHIKDGIRRAVAEMEGSPGMPMAERVAKLEALDKRIDRVNADIASLGGKAKAAGISVNP